MRSVLKNSCRGSNAFESTTFCTGIEIYVHTFTEEFVLLKARRKSEKGPIIIFVDFFDIYCSYYVILKIILYMHFDSKIDLERQQN